MTAERAEILKAALTGYAVTMQKLADQMTAIQNELRGGTAPVSAFKEAAQARPRRWRLTPEGKLAIQEGNRKRWAAFHARKAAGE